MGLDVTAYSKLKVASGAPAYENWEGDDYDRFLHFYENSHFPGTACGLDLTAIYERPSNDEACLDFRAGSYSGYNFWRDHLCQMAHGMSAKAFWELEPPPDAFKELINFSDCEGTIGPVVAAKLARDFAAFQEKADRYVAHDPRDASAGSWWRSQYATWRKAFELAAVDGAVEFH